MTYLKEGDKAPDFSAKDQFGKVVSLKDFKGKKLIVFFYPQDNTPTCTTEACNLRDYYKELKKEGFEVLGVSSDSEKSHLKFISKNKLPYNLLCDIELKMHKAYGVWGKKKLFGREYMGTLRTTFVISEKGVIEKVFTKVESKNHAQQILENYLEPHKYA
jgi:peroxiredoxin Q/BCP